MSLDILNQYLRGAGAASASSSSSIPSNPSNNGTSSSSAASAGSYWRSGNQYAAANGSISAPSPICQQQQQLQLQQQDDGVHNASSASDWQHQQQHHISGSLTPLQSSQRLSLPQSIFSHYENMRFKCFMGIFDEIERCWISIDNKFFVWSFDQKDFTIYEELDQVILSVGLVRPKQGVFKDYIEYLLILATPVEVQIVAVLFDQGELTLLPTNYSIATDNVNMLTIAGTDNGRIFLCGADGHLYELVYEAKSGFFRRKVRKLNHTQNFFGNLMPSFLKWTSDEPIIDITIDNSRNILYTLSESSTIDVWYLGPNGDDMQRVVSYTNAFKDAQRFSSSTDSTSQLNPLLNKQNFKLIYITAIQHLDSENQYTLVAVSKQGQQFYFNCMVTSVYGSTTTALSSKQKPTDLKLMQVRHTTLNASNQPTDPSAASSNGNSSSSPSEIHECFYKNGVFLLADATTEEKDQLIGVCLEPAPPSSRTEDTPDLYESISTFDVQGKTLALAERPTRLSISFGKAFEEKQPFNELARQHYYPPREFVCLSNTGIQMIKKLRPVDVLKLILQETPSPTSDNQGTIKSFFTQYGRDEACYMCLLIACSGTAGGDPLATHSTSFATSSEMVRKARQLFLSMGGEPRPPRHTSSYSSSQFTRGMGGPISAPSVTYSSAHNGLMLYFSRMIAPLWFSPIVVGREYSSNGSKKYEISSVKFQNKELAFVKNQLKGLDHFLTKQAPFLYGGGSNAKQKPGYPGSLTSIGGSNNVLGGSSSRVGTSDRSTNPENTALLLEQESIFTLLNANRRCIQILAFLEILNEHSLVRFLRGVHADNLKALAELQFSHFVWKQDAGIMKDLIRLIVRKSDSEEPGANDDLFKRLGTECANFFTASDIKECEGFEYLNLVRKNTDESTTRALCERALESFTDAIKNAGEAHGSIDIGPVCRQFRKVGDYSAAVKLALYAAQAVDPNDAAYEILQQSTLPPTSGFSLENTPSKEAYQKRSKCYAAALEALEELYNPEPLRESSKQSLKQLPRRKLSGEERVRMRNRIVAQMCKSSDRLFHLQLFNWYIQNRKQDQDGLLRLPSPHLEEFLRNNYPQSQLLARYYELHERWDQAAKVLSHLASTVSAEDMNLDSRIALLTRSINCAKRSNTAGNILQQLQNRLDVALVQKQVLEQLKQNITDEDTRKKAIRELDSQFMSLSDLYNNYSVRYRLFEASLAILECSNFKNHQPIYHLWVNIVTNTIAKQKQDSPAVVATNIQSALRAKLGALARKYYPSLFFPVDFVVAMVEKLTFHYKFEPGWILDAFVSGGGTQMIVPHEELYRAYKAIHLYLVGREDFPMQSLIDVDAKYYLLTPSDETKRYILSTLITILENWTAFAAENKDVDFAADIYSDLGMLESDAGRLSETTNTGGLSRNALVRRVLNLRTRWSTDR